MEKKSLDCLPEAHFSFKDTQTRREVLEKDIPCTEAKESRAAVFSWDKRDFKTKAV